MTKTLYPSLKCFPFLRYSIALLRSHFQTPSWRHGHNRRDPGKEGTPSPNPAELPAQLSHLLSPRRPRPPSSSPRRGPTRSARIGHASPAPTPAPPKAALAAPSVERRRSGSGRRGDPRSCPRLGPAHLSFSDAADSSPRPRRASHRLRAQLPVRARDKLNAKEPPASAPA
ncbi:unnamed protein product [Coccothraustes coccothraustes]